MASKKVKSFMKVLLFIVAPLLLVVWWFKFRLVDKWGNKFSFSDNLDASGDRYVLINGSSASGGSLKTLQKFADGTVGGINSAGRSYYWNNTIWTTKS